MNPPVIVTAFLRWTLTLPDLIAVLASAGAASIPAAMPRPAGRAQERATLAGRKD